MDYKAVEEYICSIQKFTTKNTLEHTRKYLKALGNLETSSKIIHIAGTNGKGSVCHYLNCLLRESGHTVGVFTSPHLVEMRERIMINDELVTASGFVNAFEKVKEVIDLHKDQPDWYHPTFFEFLFLMAMYIFEKEKPEYIILETGMGGRMDATNVFDSPAITVITEIGLDHCQYLGNTKEQIAYEKAGIIKKGVPLVYVGREQNVTDVLKKYAKIRNCEVYSIDKSRYENVYINNKTIDFSYKSRYYNNIGFTLSTVARYQVENAVTALVTYEILFKKDQIDIREMKRAMKRAHWAGRMEEVSTNLFIDGAHNEDGIDAFLESVRLMKNYGKKIVLFSVVSDKEYILMIDKLVSSKLFDQYIVTGLHDKRGLSKEKLEQIFDNRVEPYNVIVATSVKEAMEYAKVEQGSDDVIYVVGSLYLVGEVKALLKEE